LGGQIDGDVFRYDDMRTPGLMGAVGFHTQAASQEFSKLSPSLQETILYALAPAA
jgi:hypothetical protein